MLEPNTILQERYQITRLIGQGGMGAVYEALDKRLGTIVALKQTLVPGSQYGRAFEREARLLAGLRHPSLPKVIDHFVDESGQYLVMEYIGGEDLASLLEKRGAPFSVREVMAWAQQLLRVLEHLHSRQPPILHRDIKPQNLKLTGEGVLVLLDFGLAKGDPSVQTQASTPGSVFGYTAQYAPIEQIHNSGTDARSDLYALAATLHHLLSGSRPVDALTRATMVLRRQADPLRSPTELNPRVPPGVSAVLMQALSLNQDERPVDAAAMRLALAQAAEEADPQLVPSDLPRQEPPAARAAPAADQGPRLRPAVARLLGRPGATPVVIGLVALLLLALAMAAGAGRGSDQVDVQPTQTSAVAMARPTAPPATLEVVGPGVPAATATAALAPADGAPSASAIDPPDAFAGSLPIAVEVRGVKLDAVREFRFTSPGGATIEPLVQRQSAAAALLVINELPLMQGGEQTFTLYLDGEEQPLAMVLRDYLALKKIQGVTDSYLYTGRIGSDASGLYTQMLSDPDASSAPVALLRPDDQIDVLRDDVDGWYQVRLWIDTQSARRSVVGWIERWLVDDEGAPQAAGAPQATETPAAPRFVGVLGPVKTDQAVQCGKDFRSSVFGGVKDVRGSDAAGVLVRVTSSDGRNTYTQRTKSNGQFNIGGLGCTTWIVEVVEASSGVPAASNRVSVKLNGGLYTSADVRFTLQP